MSKKYKSNPKIISNSELMKEWDFEKNSELGFDPSAIALGSKRKAFWICSKCGFKWSASINNRNNGNGCNGLCRLEKRKKKKTIEQKNKFNEKRIKTCIEKFGTDSPNKNILVKEKMKKTNLERYGVENPFQSEIIKLKIKETCIEKYGTEYAIQSEEIQNIIKQNCIDKYGVDHPNKVPEIKDRAIQTCIKRYGVRSPSQVPEFKEKKIQTSLKNCGKPYHLCKEIHEKGDRAKYNKRYNDGFTKILKNKIKERDNYICQYPECNSNKDLCVHHIDNIKPNNNPINLITLCHSCHSRITVLFPSNPEYYINLFKPIIEEKYEQKHS